MLAARGGDNNGKVSAGAGLLFVPLWNVNGGKFHLSQGSFPGTLTDE